MHIDKLYILFNEKMPTSKEMLLPAKDKLVTFWNPYSILKSKTCYEIVEQFTCIASDGILPVLLQKIFASPIITDRYSFDMSSIAGMIFDYSVKNDLGVYFIGSEYNIIDKFVNVVTKKYPGLKLSGYHDGYVSGLEQMVVQDILLSNPDVIIVGMGTPLQEKFALQLRNSGFHGTVYTCGGFFHQASKKFDYFGGYINKFHLRAIYRMIKEPYVIKRVILYYPIFLVTYSWFLVKNKFRIH